MNTFGHLFRITTFGESHGGAVGVVVDGCPAGLKIDLKDFDVDLKRRRTGRLYLLGKRQIKLKSYREYLKERHSGLRLR